MSVDYAEVAGLVRNGRRFLVCCHKRPDADALGSALGFAAVLRAEGKDVVVYVPEPLPLSVKFLGSYEIAASLDEAERFDATFCMDTAARSLLPAKIPPREHRGPLVIIDHHAVHDDVGDIVLRDTGTCSTGEVVMDFAEFIGCRPVPAEAATPLYSAIVADTGGFRYPPTSAKTLRLGAELLELGAQAWPIAYELFEGWPEARLKLLSAILDTLELKGDGKLALLRVTRSMLAELGATDDMVEGMVNYGRMLRGVEVAALLWEFPGESGGVDVKVSLRSAGRVDISKIALALGGGGHQSAAGAQLSVSLAEVEANVCEEALAAIAMASDGDR